jgi:7,8-dihydropterin-6-yl-methyl-4-(beta-D-ribofuranosyl)aminobenzene 5'-phosphate synthase
MTRQNRGNTLRGASEVAEMDAMPPKPQTDQSGTIAFHAVDRLDISVIADNYYDSSRPDVAIAKRYRSTPGKAIHAEHGFSCYLETGIGTEDNRLMFDFGLDPHNAIHNMDLLAIDLDGVGAFCLSHGHYDHWGALLEVLKHYRSKIKAGTPLYVGSGAFARRFSVRPSQSKPTDIGRLSEEDIRALNIVHIAEITDPAEVIPGICLTGNIARVTDYETGSPSLLIERENRLERDSFEGEQAAVCHVKNRGLVVLSGCAHRGIVNTVKHAQKITGIDKVHAVIGGFHLINAAPDIIEKTIADLIAIAPDYIIPTHCTGFEALVRFAEKMPGRFILNTTGTRYRFAS